MMLSRAAADLSHPQLLNIQNRTAKRRVKISANFNFLRNPAPISAEFSMFSFPGQDLVLVSIYSLRTRASEAAAAAAL